MSAPSLPPPLPPNIAKLTAPLIIGELLGTYLFGILTVQFYLYHLTFPRDPKYIKYLVYSVFILDLASTVMCFADAYHWFASGYGNIAALNDIWLSAFDTPMIGAFLAAIVQCFYSYRLWTLSKYTLPICIVIFMIAIAQVIAGIYGAVLGHIAVTFAAAGPKVLRAAYVVNIGAAVADVLIAVSMTILLTRSRTRAHQQTEFIIRRIINLTVETNLLSSALAILTVVLLVGVPGTNYFTAPSIMLGKIYSNSLLLMLNNRKFISHTVASTTAGSGSAGNTLMLKFRSRNVDSTNQVSTFQARSGSVGTSTMASKREELI
ncbi:hypothetical protein GGX14DRAFT_453747 [Mycena pura]|uniref:DUF6534 domain-containing protein n=1 Tax=Mycena pura TaxID=153505 RepID=A0AAD6YGS2_9AGAR|nr:hypothetical protein GGX14DRAFT_453747 [Mycena pura]